ncbi:MAG: SGNH/GDSL hydrolase family protein [Butyrivibrio sp.]|nr:SGNH/GDSL hydrolase family protein [Butyrivibrio sp.]
MVAFNEKKAIANKGDTYRISKLYKKLEEGEETTICFLGGSITQGSLSSTPQTCYAYRVYEWFKNNFPNGKINYVNAGVGGTTSVFGAARADRDVLSYEPDLVLVEFSVNDECNDYFMESYEGLIRKLLYYKKEIAVAAIFNFYYENGKTAERLHSKIARYYGIPAVSMQGAVYEDILSGKIEDISILSPDGLHPNDTGHDLLGRVVCFMFEKLLMEYRSGSSTPGDKADKKIKPLTGNCFESAKRLDNRDFVPQLEGFKKDEALQECVSDCFKNGWLGCKKGDRIIFDLNGENRCSSIAVQYDKTIKRPAPVVSVTVDGDTDNNVIIDSAFEETWGDLLDIKQLFLHKEIKEHKLEIEVIDDKEGKAVPFNLVSVIITK